MGKRLSIGDQNIGIVIGRLLVLQMLHQLPIVKAQLVVGRIKPVKVIGNAEQLCGKSGCFSQFLILGERVGPDTQVVG